MIFPDVIRLVFICASGFLVLLLVLLAMYMYKKDNEYKKIIIRPICVGIGAIIIYSLFLVAGNHSLAVFFDSMYFIGTDWLAMYMCIFAIGYTGIGSRYIKKIELAFAVLCSIDSISLFVNNFKYHMFDLVYMTAGNGLEYWGNAFKFPHYLHLALCYVMVMTAFILFIVSVKKTPSVCKVKYVGILLAYVVVIIANLISYSLNFPFDWSVILYGVLAAFICYYSTYTYPHKLLMMELTSINNTVSDAIMYFDVNGKCVYSNKRAHELFENDNKFEPYMAEAYCEKWQTKINDSSHDNDVVSGEDCFKTNGREHHFLVEYRKEYYEKVLIGYCMKMMDITNDYVSYRKERYVATHDAFTGILNRNGFFEAVDALIEEKGTFGYILLTSNIRDFKVINDMFGEKIGDEIILKQAGILKTFSHPGTLYARISDDKFALYTKREYFNEKEFLEYMKLMQKVMDKPLYQLRLVVGIYQPQGRVETAQAMYDKALLATTQISSKYNETFAYYDTILMEKLMNEKTITKDFDSAIKNHEIEMYLQPIIDKNGNHVGAEALSRWNHPSRGFLLPAEFINILEKSGLIYQLDTYMWEEAAKLLRKWADKGIKDKYIAVNVSVKDFFYTDIYKTFSRLVDTYDIEPGNLHIEITEFVLMSDFAKADNLATKLKKAGFCVSIDDFGNGYSSLNMLKDFPADVLKLGLDLLKSSVEQNRDRIILESIVNMANVIGMKVVAEGVETEEQYELLKNCNCDLFQGNYLYKPKAVSEYEEMLFN